MQEIWLAGLDWDSLIPNNLAAKWEKWLLDLPYLSHVAIPRSLDVANPASLDLHMFADVSRDAYATVVYLVCSYHDNVLTSRRPHSVVLLRLSMSL